MKKDKFLEVIDLTPLVSIDLIIQRTDNKYLVGERTNKPAQGYWFVPGGRIRKNESLSTAMKRISVIELGVEIKIEDTILLGAYDHIYDDNFNSTLGVNTHYVALGYRVSVPMNITISTDSQHANIKWLSAEELIASNVVHENTKRYFDSK